MKGKNFIFFFIICVSPVARAEPFSIFQKSLVQYCVPKTENSCINKATYDEKNNTCNCSGGLLYLDRECRKVKCPAGTYITLVDNYTDDCPAGMYKFN